MFTLLEQVSILGHSSSQDWGERETIEGRWYIL